MSALTIGQVAKRVGIGVETVRFYERKGLIEEPPRKESGYRQYGEEDVERLIFIQHAKTLGFSLKEINELLSIRGRPEADSREVKEIASAKLVDIENKIRLLERMQLTLKKLVEQCPGEGPTCECPILEAIEKENLEGINN
jgi:MerR family mercuric resistance operon transcriptional regulator